MGLAVPSLPVLHYLLFRHPHRRVIPLVHLHLARLRPTRSPVSPRLSRPLHRRPGLAVTQCQSKTKTKTKPSSTSQIQTRSPYPPTPKNSPPTPLSSSRIPCSRDTPRNSSRGRSVCPWSALRADCGGRGLCRDWVEVWGLLGVVSVLMGDGSRASGEASRGGRRGERRGAAVGLRATRDMRYRLL